ncbi:MAG: hypothetical protein L6Q57_03485 [Alphaproteobacteria bacterium]|nr:hypothetical protein [Alphaproteobacteria bacterium]
MPSEEPKALNTVNTAAWPSAHHAPLPAALEGFHFSCTFHPNESQATPAQVSEAVTRALQDVVHQTNGNVPPPDILQLRVDRRLQQFCSNPGTPLYGASFSNLKLNPAEAPAPNTKPETKDQNHGPMRYEM